MEKKYVLAENGYEIQIGDIIQIDNPFGTRNKEVTRVTEKFAYYPNNEVSESKFKRIYSSFGWGSLPREKYPMNHYKVFKKII